MGGLDIFLVREINGEWGTPHRLDEPINSTADDISYTAADENGMRGFIASNREGKRFNLFSFNFNFPIFSDCQQQEKNDYSYEFWDEHAVELSDTVTVKYRWDLGDGNILYGEVVEHTYTSTGIYEIHLNLIDTLTNEIHEQVAKYRLEVLDIEQPYISVGDTLHAGTATLFDASKSYLPDMDIAEYYWIMGDGRRTKGIRTEHVYKTPGVYRIQLGVTGRSKYTGAYKKVSIYREVVVVDPAGGM